MREALLLLAVFVLLHTAKPAIAQNWERFRGPAGAGQSDDGAIPDKWDAQNFLWRRPLAGVGHSSPVVWGKRVFVTSADRKSDEQVVSAFDSESGQPLWERRLAGEPYALHAQSSFASSTPTLDAERLYMMWRSGDRAWLIAFTHGGEEVWRREVGNASDENGFGVSPIVMEGVVIAAVENEIGDSAITGFDAATGGVLWKTPRPSAKSPYCTPCTIESAGGKQLFVAASTAAGLSAFDPSNGQIVWKAAEKDFPQRIVGSPIAAGGLVITSCGLTGNGLHVIAIRAGDGSSPPLEAYRITESVPYVPTPVVAGDLLFLWGDRGIVSCYDLPTGALHWRQRVGGSFNCSPIRVGGRIFCVSMDGEVVVIAADKKYQLLARNVLDEPTSATPAVAGGRMFLRTESSLVCIGDSATSGK